jgi:predicted DNA repair protein MutK
MGYFEQLPSIPHLGFFVCWLALALLLAGALYFVWESIYRRAEAKRAHKEQAARSNSPSPRRARL